MENFVISAQISDLNQLFLKSLIFFSQKTIGVAGDTKNELKNSIWFRKISSTLFIGGVLY